jgi:hypothetical protein
MKLKVLFFLFVMTAVIFMAGCEKESKTCTDLSGKLTSHSGCKNKKSATMESETADTLSCVNYSFDPSTNKLLMKHINAGFNCCPESLYCEITLKNDTIIVQEHETDGMCDCDCLFDLDIELINVEAEKYQVQFKEPYAMDQEELQFEMDLTKDANGSFCVIRKQYPWGVLN